MAKESELHHPPDLTEMDEADQAKEVYAWAGLALFYAQVFEQGVINLICFARLAKGNLADEFSAADEFYDSRSRRVLGQLLKELTKEVDLAEEVATTINEALGLRNLLAHRFFAERDIDFSYVSGRQTMVSELWDMYRTFIRADRALEQLTFEFSSRFAITPARVRAEMDVMLGRVQ